MPPAAYGASTPRVLTPGFAHHHLADGVYQAPERLPERVNCGVTRFNAFVAPDESYVILGVVGRDDAISPADYHVVFRNPDGSWHEPRNLGKPINLPGVLGYSPAVSPDGRYFFS